MGPRALVTGVHHVSRTVSNMDRSLDFYCGLLGLEVIADEELSGEAIEASVGLNGAALRFVELGLSNQAPFVELLNFHSPDGATLRPRPCDVGAHHVALTVSDIRSVAAALTTAGVRFTADPQRIGGGFFTGDWTAYCLDPDDLLVELWQPT
jgi:catechol 2,3-dioxygenase-like lactoylglutathione lyase family enzyme